jgi:hypothetical protein
VTGPGAPSAHIGVAVFTIASLACAASATLAELITARVPLPEIIDIHA